jgi:hypothetical protein
MQRHQSAYNRRDSIKRSRPIYLDDSEEEEEITDCLDSTHDNDSAVGFSKYSLPVSPSN